VSVHFFFLIKRHNRVECYMYKVTKEVGTYFNEILCNMITGIIIHRKKKLFLYAHPYGGINSLI
jgi:hypothetical protein